MSARATAIAAAVAGAVFAPLAAADDNLSSKFSVSGFGTLGVSHSNNEQADFVASVFRPNGAGGTRSWSAAVDTKLGVQVTAALTDNLTGVVQFISQQRNDNSYRPNVEWANVSYKFSPDLSVRLGRVVWPLFTRSDSVNVGYSNFSIRSSAELAAEMPNTYSDGVDASYRFTVGGTSNTLTVLWGNSKVRYPGETYLDTKNIRGLSHVLEIGDLTLHAAYMKMDYIFAYPGGSPDAVHLPMLTLGGVYDNGKWFAQGDVLRANDPYYGRMDAYAAIGGVRLGSFSPYVGYSRFKQSTYGPGSSPLVTPSQSTTTLGLRWDLMKNTALKLQADRIRSGDVATVFPISLIFPQGTQGAFLQRPTATVTSVVLDFVF